MTPAHTATRPHSLALPRLVIADGTIEALKWLGVALMTIDHINKYLFNETNTAAFAAGRIAMPIFTFVLAYNLARPGTLERGVYPRTALRLTVFGLLATPVFMALGGLLAGVYPLNIMFTLLAGTAVLYLVERRAKVAAVAAFVVGGAVVEFWWPAVGFCVAVWLYTRSPGWRSLGLGLACCASLWAINGNLWVLASLPIILVATRFDLTLPRARCAFYAYYPLHLSALWLIRIPMAKAGYLFF